MKSLFFLICSLILVSCVDSQIVCDERIRRFQYPADIELLEKKKYICDSIIPYEGNKNALFYNQFKILFSDKNYWLIGYDEKTRILIDNREDLCFAFKATESNNFFFNDSSKEEVYGLSNIYLLDKNFMPLFSFNNDNVFKFYHDYKTKRSYYKKLILINSLSPNIDNYKYLDLIKFARFLKNGDYKELDEVHEDYFFDDPPTWTDL